VRLRFSQLFHGPSRQRCVLQFGGNLYNNVFLLRKAKPEHISLMFFMRLGNPATFRVRWRTVTNCG
jgi:hypothetical protein